MVRDLIERWRSEMDTLRKWGAGADILGRCINELESVLDAEKLEAITLGEAVRVSGYSYSSLQKKVAGGELPNIGKKGSPRVRKGDLPKKAAISGGIADEILVRRVA